MDKLKCSYCGKKIWFWQNRWSLGNPNEKPHDYWHLKCAIPLHEMAEDKRFNLEMANAYLKKIKRFSLGVEDNGLL